MQVTKGCTLHYNHYQRALELKNLLQYDYALTESITKYWR